MKQVFRPDGDGVQVSLAERELDVLRTIPLLLDGIGEPGEDPGADRLTYLAHPKDPAAEEAYRDLVAGRLEGARSVDRSRFAASLGRPRITIDEADAWLRVIGEARLVLAGRLGITEDGWSEAFDADEPVEMSLLRLLGAYQDELVEALLGG